MESSEDTVILKQNLRFLLLFIHYPTTVFRYDGRPSRGVSPINGSERSLLVILRACVGMEPSQARFLTGRLRREKKKLTPPKSKRKSIVEEERETKQKRVSSDG